MTTMTKPDEIKAIRKEYKWFYPFTAGIIILMIGFMLGATWFKGDDNGLAYATNLYTEIISIGITIVILDRINEYRNTQRLKRRLIREAGSKANNTAVSAVDGLRHEDWLTGEDGLLKGTNLIEANLEGADLRFANLEGATLDFANLEGANLFGANLEGANLINPKLEGANLGGAHLEGANLFGAKLKGTNLIEAHLEGANLSLAKLEGADLGGAHLEGADLSLTHLEGANLFGAKLEGADLIGAKLPDGKGWTPETDMSRFTDENHPDFWQPPTKDD